MSRILLPLSHQSASGLFQILAFKKISREALGKELIADVLEKIAEGRLL